MKAAAGESKGSPPRASGAQEQHSGEVVVENHVGGAEREVLAVSTEMVMASEERKGCDTDGTPVQRVLVRTVVPEFAGAHASYTGETWRLECEDQSVATI